MSAHPLRRSANESDMATQCTTPVRLPEMVTLQEAAREMNIPPTTIRDWCRCGHIKFMQPEGGRRIYIRKDDLADFVTRSICTRKD